MRCGVVSSLFGKTTTKFLKEILEHCKTSNNACYAELGGLPIRSKIILFAVKYLDHLISNEHTLVHDIFIKTIENNAWSMCLIKVLS